MRANVRHIGPWCCPAAAPAGRDGSVASAGFTLVEVLASLLILALGLAVVLGMFARSSVSASYAAGENALAIMAPMAAAEIERYHKAVWLDKNKGNPDEIARGAKLDTAEFDGDVAQLKPAFWPRRGTGIRLADSAYCQGGATYCARYTLRRLFDPDKAETLSEEQKTNMIEQTRGLYVLTMVFYRVDPRDFESKLSDDDDRLLRKLVQVGDPLVVYLADERRD